MNDNKSDVQFRKVSKGNVYLVFFDILGYKEVNRNNSNDETSAAYEIAIQQAMSSAKRFYRNIIFNTKQDGVRISVEEYKLDYTIISDSIIIQTKKDDLASFFVLLSSPIHRWT